MSQVQARPTSALPRGALRVVLFGMPDAGKSSLLGALAEAAEAQPHGLGARLVDAGQGLARLRHTLYEGQPTRTVEQVVPYPVQVTPLAANGSVGAAPVEAVLFDCDGQAANQLLSQSEPLEGAAAEGPLGDAVLRADTLVLTVDASANPEVVRRDFGQFARFLRLLEQGRSSRAEVGGLPVYLVLTKCDLLARPGDSAVAWMERIEEHKRAVDRKFQEYLAQQAAREAQPFGKIDLHVWATAVKQPALEGSPARPRQPYGVGELFRQCLRSAEDFRSVQARAGRRLGVTVAALAGLVGLLVLLALFFYATRPSTEAGALESEIGRFLSGQGETPAQRLAGPLEEKIRQLERFQADPSFAQVAPRQQQAVRDQFQELRAYRDFQRLLEDVPDPRLARTDGDLNRVFESLGRVAVPEKYAAGWRDTKAGRLREQRRREADLLRKEVNKAEAALKDLVTRWNKAQTDPLTATQRRAREKELLNEADGLPYREENRDRFLPGSQGLTYENVLQFDRVAEVYREWRAIRQEQK